MVHAARTESCSCVVDTHGEGELRVIGVLVVVNTVVCDDVTHRAAVDGKQQRPEDRPCCKATCSVKTMPQVAYYILYYSKLDPYYSFYCRSISMFYYNIETVYRR